MSKFLLVFIGSVLFLIPTVLAEETKSSYATVIALYQQDETGSATQFVFSEDQKKIVIAASGCKSGCIKTKNSCVPKCGTGPTAAHCRRSCINTYRSCMRGCN